MMTFFSDDNVLEMPRRQAADLLARAQYGEGFHGEIEKLRETHKANGRQTPRCVRRPPLARTARQGHM